VTSHSGDVTADDVCAAGDGVVGLVDCVTAQHDGISANPRLGVDDCVAADDGGIAVDATAYVEVSKENESTAG